MQTDAQYYIYIVLYSIDTLKMTLKVGYSASNFIRIHITVTHAKQLIAHLPGYLLIVANVNYIIAQR